MSGRQQQLFHTANRFSAAAVFVRSMMLPMVNSSLYTGIMTESSICRRLILFKKPMEDLIKFGYPNLVSNRMDSLSLKWKTHMNTKVYADRKVWFSMWFLGAIVTFGVAFFPMFYRLVEGRNRHFQKEAEFEKQVAAYLKSKGKGAACSK